MIGAVLGEIAWGAAVGGACGAVGALVGGSEWPEWAVEALAGRWGHRGSAVGRSAVVGGVVVVDDGPGSAGDAADSRREPRTAPESQR